MQANKDLEIIKETLKIWDGDHKTGERRQQAWKAASRLAARVEELEKENEILLLIRERQKEYIQYQRNKLALRPKVVNE